MRLREVEVVDGWVVTAILECENCPSIMDFDARLLEKPINKSQLESMIPQLGCSFCFVDLYFSKGENNANHV